jgi:dual adaptor for phosphotyrosine/3-phosphotyrosine/3-phosphoinositide
MEGEAESLTRIQQLTWYHPTSTRHVAESLLMNGSDGSYLLRPGKTPKRFVLSVRGRDSVKHYPVTFEDGTFQLGLTSFTSVDDFLKHFGNQPLLGAESGVLTVLKHPYPRVVEEPSHYDVIRVHAQLGPRLTRSEVPLTIATKEGFLTKRGGLIKNWKLRYFVLKKNELRYYRQRTDTKPLRVIDLQGCTECAADACDGRPNGFRLTFPWRVFYFSASSPGEAKDWIDIILWKLEHLQSSHGRPIQQQHLTPSHGRLA